MVSVCLPSDALLQHLPSYLGFYYLGRGVSLHGCSSKAQPLLLTLDEGYLLTTALPNLQHGMAPLGPPAPVQPPLLGCGFASPRHHPWPRVWGCSSSRLCRPQQTGKNHKEMEIPDLLITCFLLNLYADQEATIRTGHGTTDWFLIGKGIQQVCILSSCLFNFYAEPII